jgi:hypothetical protein
VTGLTPSSDSGVSGKRKLGQFEMRAINDACNLYWQAYDSLSDDTKVILYQGTVAQLQTIQSFKELLAGFKEDICNRSSDEVCGGVARRGQLEDLQKSIISDVSQELRSELQNLLAKPSDRARATRTRRAWVNMKRDVTDVRIDFIYDPRTNKVRRCSELEDPPHHCIPCEWAEVYVLEGLDSFEQVLIKRFDRAACAELVTILVVLLCFDSNFYTSHCR